MPSAVTTNVVTNAFTRVYCHRAEHTAALLLSHSNKSDGRLTPIHQRRLDDALERLCRKEASRSKQVFQIYPMSRHNSVRYRDTITVSTGKLLSTLDVYFDCRCLRSNKNCFDPLSTLKSPYNGR